MAKDTGRSPAIQKKLFGPFNGLNGTQSPFMRELPPAPNARPHEFATEFLNLIQNQDTQELVSRYGIEFVEKGSATAPAISATAGLFKWIDYDVQTGKPRERLINLVVDADGLPSVVVYRFIKTQVRITDNSLNGKKFAIIEDPDASYAKRFMIYNSNDSVFASYTTLAGVTNTSVSYVDYDADRDGAFVLGAVDLLSPVTMVYSASDGTPATVAEFWSLCKKTTVGTGLDLTAWVDALDTEDAAFWTAAPINNVIYFSGGGSSPLLKYDGQALYKAGMPHAAIHGEMGLNLVPAATWEAASRYDLSNTFEGLMNPSLAANVDFIGRFVWINTYERGDAKNNYIEGDAYLPASFTSYDLVGSPVTNAYPLPRHRSLIELSYSGSTVSGDVMQYEPNSLVESDGYDARGALFDAEVVKNYSQTGDVITITDVAHGKSTGDEILFSVVTGSASNVLVDRVITVVDPDTYTVQSDTVIATSGTAYVYTILTPSDVTSDFTLAVDSSNHTLKAGDIVCIRALIFDNFVSQEYTAERFPLLITGRLASVTSTSITFDTSYNIQVEICPGGEFTANALDGTLSQVGAATQLALSTNIQSLSTWDQLLNWDWLRETSSSRIYFPTEFCVSNNLRINVYRNKANANEDNSYSPTSTDSEFVPSFFLVNILPNNPFAATTVMGRTYDNCKDGNLGAPLVIKQTLLVEDVGSIADFTDVSYSTLPKGSYIGTYKGRGYISGDPENANILYRSSILYGPEYYDVGDTLSMETPVGDEVQAVVGNDEAIFILKDNSIKIIINDLENNRIRIDDFTVGDDGCVAPRSAVPLENGVAYLTSNGPAWVQTNKQIAYLGENANGVSRIKDRLTDTELDLKRAVACVDTNKQLYQLYIPRITKTSSGLYNPTDLRHSDNPYYTDDGIMFIFDYANDAWYEQSGINAKGGMVFLEQSGGGRNMYLTAYAKNTSESESTLEWALYKDRNYNNLWNYADRLERGGTEELRAIECVYGTDWLAMEDPNELKKWLRCKIYAIRTFDDLTVLGSSSTPLAASGATELEITAYPNWRSDTTHSQATIDLTATNLFAHMKCRNMHATVMKFRIAHETLFASPRIQAIEIEATSPFKAKMKPWGQP